MLSLRTYRHTAHTPTHKMTILFDISASLMLFLILAIKTVHLQINNQGEQLCILPNSTTCKI